ncbi:MAG: PAS domain S-box protein [Deltaproteobacteria bacterium]|jgi:two-component system nitrogen regulation sensor histidine kinase NtrY|nr:PAS domain S-box protein [Deltaproteobacteria bacterium]
MPLFPGDTGHAGRRAEEAPASRDAPGWRIPAAPSLVKSREERHLEATRRRRELSIAAAAFALMLCLIFIQLQYIGSGSILFFALFNLNVILLIGILFVVLRNAIKMILERKRRVIGSRLRTRLVILIAGMTILPCLVMFLVTAQFVGLSVDFWFRNQIEASMGAATELAGSFLSGSGNRMRLQAEYALREITGSGHILGGPQMNSLLDNKITEHGLAMAEFLDREKFERGWNQDSPAVLAWPSVKGKIDWQDISAQGYKYYPSEAAYGDFLYGVLPINAGQDGYLVLAEDLGSGFQARLGMIAGGLDEYRQIRHLKNPLKGMLYLTLTILTALIAFSIIWFAFKMVKGLTDPIMALVNSTGRLAKGEENVHIEDNSSDEIGILVNSFNSMASEIIDNRRELTETNAMLLQNNMALERQSRYVETVLDNLAAGVISFDASWKITTANQAARRIIKWKEEEISGQSIRRIINEKELAQFGDIATALAANPGEALQRQIKLSRDGREHSLLTTVAALTDSQRNFSGAVAVFEDVTDLEKMQRMAAWQEVARRIAHEIKNPLTPIKLSAQRLEKKFSSTVDDPAFIQSTKLIVRQVEQLQAMVQEFSSFAKMPDINLKRGSPTALLADVFHLFQESQPSVQWTLDLPENMPDLYMDEAALHRAFINLLTNAAEALDKVEYPAVFMRADLDAEMRRLRIEIGDNGPDLLTEEERGRIFEPYFSRKKGGTGLGLTIVRSIITAHRGYVRASRLENGGTVITVELPLLKETGLQAPE